MTDLQVQEVTVSFGSVTPLNNISLSVHHGEILFLIGPSGCGKTTLLRVIAGLQIPTQGHIFFGDTDVTNFPIRDRGVGMVFQSYCLWPHMTVEENISFGLSIQKIEAAERLKRLGEIVEITGLSGHLRKYPHQLSGGQQQRVSLARALVLRPKVLLLDEPFSNLDTTLRTSIREEVKRLREAFDLTMLFVTHDFEEAMNIGSRVVCLDKGSIQVIGTPEAVYKQPVSHTAAKLSGRVVKVPHIFSNTEMYCRPEAFSINPSGAPNGTVAAISYESSFATLVISINQSSQEIEIVLSRAQHIPSLNTPVNIEAKKELFFTLKE